MPRLAAFAALLLVTSLFLGLLAAHPALASGPVVCWDWDYYGQSTPPPSVDGTTGTATAIAAGGSHSCAIQAGSGAVICWGDDDHGQATPPPSVDGTTGSATAIAAGGSHSCAIQAGSGAVICWGDDDHGQATPPPSVDGTTGSATAIAAGGSHSCAIQAGSGAVICWGDDDHGQATPPPSVDGTTGTATAIAAGGSKHCYLGGCSHYDHSCAIQAETGVVVCWGNNSYGQVTPPPAVDGTTGTATAIAAGDFHSCAIQQGTGAVVCWGSGGQAPPSVDGTTGTATAIAAGEGEEQCGGVLYPVCLKVSHSCAIQEGTGAVVCWGSLYDGLSPPPPSVDGTTGSATAIAAGGSQSCAIRTRECSDGLDNDGDGLIDYLDDPGCINPSYFTESPQCQDGIDNDGDGKMDYDAGLSANGFADPAGSDPYCAGTPWVNLESLPTCGLGVELALLLPPLMWMWRRRFPARKLPRTSTAVVDWYRR